MKSQNIPVSDSVPKICSRCGREITEAVGTCLLCEKSLGTASDAENAPRAMRFDEFKYGWLSKQTNYSDLPEYEQFFKEKYREYLESNPSLLPPCREAARKADSSECAAFSERMAAIFASQLGYERMPNGGSASEFGLLSGSLLWMTGPGVRMYLFQGDRMNPIQLLHLKQIDFRHDIAKNDSAPRVRPVVVMIVDQALEHKSPFIEETQRSLGLWPELLFIGVSLQKCDVNFLSCENTRSLDLEEILKLSEAEVVINAIKSVFEKRQRLVNWRSFSKKMEGLMRLDTDFLKHDPWVTYCVLSICILVFLMMALIDTPIEPLNLLMFGANQKHLVFHHGQWWRTITATFVHIGIEHLAGNIAILFLLGRSIERWLGSQAFCFLYFLSGFSASLTSITVSNKISVGASGAIFGVIGSAIAIAAFSRGVAETVAKRSFAWVSVFAIYNLIRSFFKEGIDFGAHIGGAITGFALTGILMAVRLKAINETVQPDAPTTAEFPLRRLLPRPIFFAALGSLIWGICDQCFKQNRVEIVQKLETKWFYDHELKISFQYPALSFFQKWNSYPTDGFNFQSLRSEEIKGRDYDAHKKKTEQVWLHRAIIRLSECSVDVSSFSGHTATSPDKALENIRSSLERRKVGTFESRKVPISVTEQTRRTVKGREWMIFDGTSSEVGRVQAYPERGSQIPCLRAVCEAGDPNQLVLIEIYFKPRCRDIAFALQDLILESMITR